MAHPTPYNAWSSWSRSLRWSPRPLTRADWMVDIARAGRHSSILHQTESAAVGVGDGCDQPAATNVARRLLHSGACGAHLGQLRLDVRHVPVGDRRGHPLPSSAWDQPDVLAGGLGADVVGLAGLRPD